jgi:pimeloyl-ACP methyl ester carboxylesterase
MRRASGFRMGEARAAYCRLYDEAIAQTRESVEEVDLDGRYGTTHVLVAGDPSNAPLVALHAKSMSSTMWLPLLPALSSLRRVYMLDAVGDLNKSIARRVLSNPAHVVSWIDETLDALSVESTALLGASMGTWMGAHYAMANPDRVERLALVCPAGLVSRQHTRWLLSAIFAAGVRPTTDRVTAFFDSMAMPLTAPRLREDPWRPVVQQFIEGTPAFRSRLNEARPRLANLDALARCTFPILVLIGMDETLHDGNLMAQRFTQKLPNAHIVLVEDANHLLFIDQTEHVVENLRVFLDPNRRAASASENDNRSAISD